MPFSRLLKQTVLVNLALVLFSSTAFALGVSPGAIEVMGIKPENKAEEEFFLSRADASQDEFADLTITGEGSEAISLESSHILLPHGESSVPVHFTITPKNLKPGVYKVKVPIQFAPYNEDPSLGVQFLPGLAVTINFSVTMDDIEKGHVQMGNIKEISEGEAFVLTYNWSNDGNTENKLGKIDIKLTASKTGEEYQETIPSEKLPAIAPFSQESFAMETSLTPPANLYQLTAVFYDNQGQAIYTYDAPNQIKQKTISTTLAQIIPTEIANGFSVGIVVISLIALILISFLLLKPLLKHD